MFTKQKIDTNKMFVLMIFMIPIVVILCSFCNGINGNDFWWHIKVGESIARNKTIPTKDIFSWYGIKKGLEWTAHEWLAEVIFYIIYHLFGSLGLFIFSVSAAILLYLLLWNSAKKYSDTNVLFLGLFFLHFGLLTSFFIYGRPHIFSYFLLFIELNILYGFMENNKSKAIYFIPFLAALWSNLHGGSSSLSYIICIIFIIAGISEFSLGRIQSRCLDKKELVKLIIVTFGTLIAIMLNPNGLKLIAYPYVTLSDSISMKMISEWQAPDAKNIGEIILYFFPILLMSIGIISDKRKVQLVDLLVMLLFLFLFFRSKRFIILWYIAAVFYAFKYMPELKVKPVTKKYEKILLCIVWILLLLPIAASFKNMHAVYKEDMLISKVMSEEAVGVIKKDSPERLFNDYNLGEALIYNDIPVFFDARADMYVQHNILADGVSLMSLSQMNKSSEKAYVDVDELINKYRFDAVVILRERSLYSYIISHPEQFKLIYEDNDIAYFRIKTDTENY